MKTTAVLTALAAFATVVSASVTITAAPKKSIATGKSFEVEWSQTEPKTTLELWVVKETSDGWQRVKTLFENRVGHSPGGNFTWDVTEVAGENYGLWLHSSGYAALSNYFDIKSE